MGAASKRARRVRTAAEFDTARLSATVNSPFQGSNPYAWIVSAIRSARDSQNLGHFSTPRRLSVALKTDGAIYTAILNRLAPAAGLPIDLSPPDVPARLASRAKMICAEAVSQFGRGGISLTDETIADIHEQLAWHGVAFGRNTLNPRADGSRVDILHNAWPIEFVRWRTDTRSFWTMTHGGVLEEIVHGNGRWVIYRQHEIYPWTWGALLPLSEIWMDRAYGRRDRARASVSHGNAKMIGEMPEGVALQDATGAPTKQAAAFYAMLASMHGDLPVGLRPAGSKTDMIVNTSQAWQIFQNIIADSSKDAASVLLGQDGTMKNEGGDYVKSRELFGVRNDIVSRDLGAMSTGAQTGIVEPWTAINFGDSSLAPVRKWLFPDGAEQARRELDAESEAAFSKSVLERRQAGFTVDQDAVNRFAKSFGVTAPTLAAPLPPIADATASPPGGPTGATTPATTPAPTEKPPAVQAAPALARAR